MLSKMKIFYNLRTISSLFIILGLFIGGCENEKDTTPPPSFYEFGITSGDSFVTFAYNFPGLDNGEYGVEITYFLNDVKEIRREFGAFSMTIDELENNETYTFTIVTYDKAGNRSDGFEVKGTPNTPFVIEFPTEVDDYTIEDGKVRIDIRFNRQADTVFPSLPIYVLAELYTDSAPVSYDFNWMEDNQGFSLLTNEPIENLCSSLPCNLILKIRFDWRGNMSYDGFCDTNGMLLDGDNDGEERGDVYMTFVLK